MPNDGGHLMLSPDERDTLLAHEPKAAKWIKPILGSVEFINREDRYCLWLVGISPQELRAMPAVLKRVADVRAERLDSTRVTTKGLAATPALFGEIRQPTSRYLAIPKTSSESRAYIPMAFLQPTIIANTELFAIAGATIYQFAILSSATHGLGSECLRALEKRLPILCRDCLQQFPVASDRDPKTAAGH
jgi:hypothetical protein